MRASRPSCSRRRAACFLAAAVAHLLFACAAQAQEASVVYVTPSVVIYPGQTVRPEMLSVRMTTARLPGGVVVSFDEAIGKSARATLAPGRLIPLAALGEAELVRPGAQVSLLFREGGLDIRAAGVALQRGSAGERIRARNAATGVIVSGTLREDGAVVVESGS